MKDKKYNKMTKIPQPRLVSDTVSSDRTKQQDQKAYREYLNEVAAREVGDRDK